MEFQDIYRGNRWNGHQTRSGPGSSRAATNWVGMWLSDLCLRLQVRSVLDAGCGEGIWQPELPGYIGVDVVPEAIEAARREHPHRTYLVADVIQDDLPNVDLVLTRDFMQHISVADGLRALENVGRGAKYLVASSYLGGINEDPTSGYDAYRVNLEATPFALGAPMERAPDGYNEAGEFVDDEKQMCVWALT